MFTDTEADTIVYIYICIYYIYMYIHRIASPHRITTEKFVGALVNVRVAGLACRSSNYFSILPQVFVTSIIINKKRATAGAEFVSPKER